MIMQYSRLQTCTPPPLCMKVTVLIPSGWGTTEDGTTSDKLKKLPYTISSKADCKTNYGEGLLDGMMCTGTAPTEKRADTGDSG